MNRKIIEDIKVHSNKTTPKPKDVLVSGNLSNHNPTHVPNIKVKDNLSKYEFLNKKNYSPAVSSPRISTTPRVPNKNHPFNKTILFFLIVSLFIGVVFLLSTVFLTANITVFSKSKNFELKHQKLTASKAKNNNNIPFEIMIVSDSDYKDIVLTNSKEVSNKSKGEIILYNEYSENSQKIIANSFVSDENGKTYRTDTTVSIPGYKLDATKKIIPGQVSVGITAFLPGEMYNGSPKSFLLTSFKGTDKYKKIYGELKTKIEGGMVGLVYLLGDLDKNELLSKNVSFKEKLMRKLSAQVPVGYILYPDAVNFNFEIGESISSKTPNSKIEIKGTLSSLILKETDLSDSIINKLLPDISTTEKSEIVKPNLSNLVFNFSNKEESINKEIENLDFELSGDLLLKWKPNEILLKQLLINKNKSEVPLIFRQDPGIVSAKVNLIPFWSKTLPKDTKNINIFLK